MGKGHTTKPADVEEWDKKYLEVTVRLPEKYSEEDFQEALLHAEYILDNWIAQSETPQLPKLDIAEINALPWKKKVNEPAKHGAFGWLFGPKSRDGTEPGAAELVKAIKATKNGKLVLGDMEYSLAKNDAFVQRKPVKRKSEGSF